MAPQQPELSPPRDLSHHFSRATKNREVSSIKQFYPFFQIPSIGNLAGGESSPAPARSTAILHVSHPAASSPRFMSSICAAVALPM
jgi:hypothetical protein